MQKSGTLFFTAHFAYEGDPQGDWDERRLTEAQLVQQGWQYVAGGDFVVNEGQRVYKTYRKSFHGGEHMRLRVNKYSPPILIVDRDFR